MTPQHERRAELVRAYRATWPAMGVWSLRRVPTGERLVGASMNLPAAYNRLRFALNLGSHRDPRLLADWRRDGESGFVWEILDELTPPEDDSRPRALVEAELREQLDTLQAMWLDELRPWGERGYNNVPNANGAPR